MSNLTKHLSNLSNLTKLLVNLTNFTKLLLNLIYVERKIRIKYDFKAKIENNIKNLNKIFKY